MSQKELIENLNEILDQKNTVLIPENIKSGINILGVEGSSYIVDTSDAIATSNDLLLSKTAYVNGQKVTGTIMDNDHLYFTPSAEDQTIPKGYTEGGTVWGDSNLKPENIKKGVEIFNVIGNYEDGLDTSDATAVASQILLGQTAYVNDVKITGTMPYQGSKIITPSSAPQIFPSGYYSDLQITTDSNLIPENIKSGITIFDVEGTMDPGLDTSDATATSKFIVEGYTAYANGAKITGGLKSSGNVNYTTNNFIRKYSDTAMNFFHQYTEDIVQWRDSRINLIINNTDIASAIDLTSDKLLEGNTVLGIEGTGQSASNWILAPDLTESGVERYFATNSNAYARRAGIDEASYLVIEPKYISCTGSMTTISGSVYNTSETDITEALIAVLNIEFANGTSMKIDIVINKVAAGSSTSFQANATANLINYRDGIIGLYISLT